MTPNDVEVDKELVQLSMIAKEIHALFNLINFWK